MKSGLLFLVFFLLFGAATSANADRRYFLVGVRHVYKLSAYPDPHESDRQQIEETYAGSIDEAQQDFDRDMKSIAAEEAQDNGNTHQVDRDAVQQNLEKAAADAEDRRDTSLGQIYTQCDSVRDHHPELNVDQEGPYEIIGISVGPLDSFIDFLLEKPFPWDDLLCPNGLQFGVVYPAPTFEKAVAGSHSSWAASGGPVFGVIYHKGRQVIVRAPVRRSAIFDHSSWTGGRPPKVSNLERQELARTQVLQQQSASHSPTSRSGSTPAIGSRYGTLNTKPASTTTTTDTSADSAATSGQGVRPKYDTGIAEPSGSTKPSRAPRTRADRHAPGSSTSENSSSTGGSSRNSASTNRRRGSNSNSSETSNRPTRDTSRSSGSNSTPTRIPRSSPPSRPAVSRPSPPPPKIELPRKKIGF